MGQGAFGPDHPATAGFLEDLAALHAARSDYAATALRYLNEARTMVSKEIGVEPLEPLGVVFYGRAAYSREHSHRFSFQTVGFFDGRIHVSSPAHPSGSLRSLLFHEYTHAVFRDQTGGDRPYWLNEVTGILRKHEINMSDVFRIPDLSLGYPLMISMSGHRRGSEVTACLKELKEKVSGTRILVLGSHPDLSFL